MRPHAVAQMAAAGALVVLSVGAIYWIGNIVVAFGIFAACGLMAGLAWPRPAALSVPMAAAVVAGVINITGDSGSFGPTKLEFMILWTASSLPGVMCGAIAIVCRRHYRGRPRSVVRSEG